ncbi:TonB-dependent receptor plug domain-containing protein [Peristeroidobacter agariperforans]|uniref:TonB-dependent receptor plug domain-containing protein n=1 Tax=Peristeroidobacter agariperforans TaxID=268404 RepID=UPI00101C72DC|nr:TonB-dependent receptor [Peristeroidobacter agariperforans]
MFAALLLLACASTYSAQPDRTTQFNFDLKRGSRAAVLKQFSRRTGLQIINVKGSQTRELGPYIGYVTVDEALQALLLDTDLSYTWQDEDTIKTYLKVVEPPRAEDGVREVLVTGSRLGFGAEGPVPVRVYDRQSIDRLGASSLPAVSSYFTQQPFSFSEWAQQSGAQHIQMRGLGVDTTLVLINGRRAPPSTSSVSLNAFDLNSIPLTAVERIEVMSDSASAIYGADAIGGVVNIILRDRIRSPEIFLHYGQAAGGGAEQRVAGSLGATTERLKSSLVLDYFDRAALMGEARDLWRNQDYRRFGGYDYRVTTTQAGNVYSLTGEPLPGLPTSAAAVPSGRTGGLSPADFLATAGTVNRGSSSSDRSIKPQSVRLSAFGSIEFDLSDQLNFFGELLAVNGTVTSLSAPPSLTQQLVPADNPFNPFGEAVLVDYSFADLDSISHTYDTEQVRMVLGARGELGRWDWEFSGQRNHENGSSTVLGEINLARAREAVHSADAQNALNLFSDGPAGTTTLLQSLMDPPRRLDTSFSSSQWSAFLRGPLFQMPGGRVEAVVGAEWRRDAAEFFESGTRIDEYRDVASMFSEIRLPLLDHLSLKLALRGDSYGSAKDMVTPQYGLVWRPSSQWLVRAAYGTSFRPPSMLALNTPMYRFSFPIADPFRGGSVSAVALIAGGNRDLDAVTAHSFTSGLTYRFSELPGLSLGGSYWRVAMDNRIVVPRYAELLNPKSDLGHYRSVRDPPSDEDVRAGWAGPLRSLDLRLINYGDLQTSGVDLDASATVEGNHGSLHAKLSATWVHEYLVRDTNQALPPDRVGIANIQGTIPAWRVVGSLVWEFRSFGASTTATFTPSYQDADVWYGPLDRHIASRTLVDLQAWVDLDIAGTTLLDGTRVTLGALNVCDETPDFANAGASLGYDISQADLTGRFIYFRITTRF